MWITMTLYSFRLTMHTSIRQLIQQLLSNLQNTYAHTVCAQAALGSAIAASLALLSQSGGKVVGFGTCLPKIGLGMLSMARSVLLASFRLLLTNRC